MAVAQAEQVLVVPTELFHQLGYFQGFVTDVDRYLPDLFDPAHTQFLPRADVEEDASFKQLIPYVVFRWCPGDSAADDPDRLFAYRRGQGQGEQRLHRQRSIGVGGHISIEDARQACPYDQGMRRELQEEVTIAGPYQIRCVGLINDDRNPVGQVHLGVVHLVDLVEPAVEPREAEMQDACFIPRLQALEEIDQFETWSQICLRALFGAPRQPAVS